MAVELTKDSIDIGIVIRESEPMLKFYRDTLGLEHFEDTPGRNGVIVHKLRCGSAALKLYKHAESPEATNPPDGIEGATGYRYCTISLRNLDEVLADCERAGYPTIWPKTPRPFGMSGHVAMVADPEGNWVEFLQV